MLELRRMLIVAIAHKSFFVGEIFLMLDSLACLVFELRSGWALQQLTAPETYGTLAYEYEKNSYPLALADVLATDEDRFVKTEGTWLTYHPFAHSFALEIGETQSHGTFEQCQTAVLRRARLTAQSAEVTSRSSQGDRLRLRPQGNRRPDIWRNGQLHDWATNANPDVLNRLARSPDTLTLP